MKRKIVTAIIAVLLFILVSYFIVFVFGFGKNYLTRAYRNFTGSYERQTTIEHYAGCRSRTMIDQLSDEEFSKVFAKYSKELNFDAKDVDEYMMAHCAPRSDEDEERAHRKYQESYEKSSGKKIDEGEMTRVIERSKSMNRYQYRFLNREFSVFKN